MDELRGPNIQIVLHVKEGLGFGFLKTPFIVSGSLNGYMLETDPTVPCHGPVFDAELVWEADKRRFRSLRVQNVPIKVEVYTVATQGCKDKVGYLLLSLLGAQPCPSNKIVDIKYSWHRLLGLKSEGKCCHPQLMMSLTIEDRVNTPTPRNELRMFHSNEVAYPTVHTASNTSTVRSMLLSLNEYIAESKKVVSIPELQPRLLCDEGLIQIGAGRQLFVLSFVIGSVENIDSLVPDDQLTKNEDDFYVIYSVFTHNIMTDRAGARATGRGAAAAFNQRTSLRLRGALAALARYFAECPHLVARVCQADRDIGICSMDLRKLVPTEELEHFLSSFCNDDKALTIHERCFILRCEQAARAAGERRPFVDVEMSLRYVGVNQDTGQKATTLTARSATQLESCRGSEEALQDARLDYRSGSCTQLHRDVGGVAYTNIDVCNTARYKNAAGDAVLQMDDIADVIRKMCESFTLSQERLLAARCRPPTSDMQVQCGADVASSESYVLEAKSAAGLLPDEKKEVDLSVDSEPVKLETSKSDTCIGMKVKDLVKRALTETERDSIMNKFVEELESWKERQQEMYKCQLKRKEEYHLDMLAKEWCVKREELECKLRRGVERCRALAADLGRAADDFRLRGYRNAEREKKLLEAKKALEAHYTAKYQELRDASQKMEDDMTHQLKLKDMRVEELELKVAQLEKHIDVLKNNIKNSEKEAENKYSGLTKDQTASLIQELRCLEEKLDSAAQSKAFFKEQWGRAVRELHRAKLAARRQLLAGLRRDRGQLAGMDPVPDEDEDTTNQSQVDIKKLKDDFYVDILVNTPALESHSMISTSGPDVMELFEDHNMAPKNPLNNKLNELIAQRDLLVQQDSPDEDALRQLNHDIRSMLLNCGT